MGLGGKHQKLIGSPRLTRDTLDVGSVRWLVLVLDEGDRPMETAFEEDTKGRRTSIDTLRTFISYVWYRSRHAVGL